MIKLHRPFLILCPAARLLSLKYPSFASFCSSIIVVVVLLLLLLLCTSSRGPSIINPSSPPPPTRSKLKGSSPLCDNRSGITKRTRRVYSRGSSRIPVRRRTALILTPSSGPPQMPETSCFRLDLSLVHTTPAQPDRRRVSRTTTRNRTQFIHPHRNVYVIARYIRVLCCRLTRNVLYYI